MTVLYDDRGLKVDGTKELLEQYQNIGIMTSGGADSTFTLYWIARCIDELGLYNTHTLQPIHAYNIDWPFDTKFYLNQIIEMIQKIFPKVTIFDAYIIEYKNTSTPDFPTPKPVYWKNIRERLENSLLDITITGSTCAPLDDDVDLGTITATRNINTKKKKKQKTLFWYVDKKFLAYQYKKFDLINNLFPLTKSCILPYPNSNPCKRCDFCKEKYWAFGLYDGGVK